MNIAKQLTLLINLIDNVTNLAVCGTDRLADECTIYVSCHLLNGPAITRWRYLTINITKLGNHCQIKMSIEGKLCHL